MVKTCITEGKPSITMTNKRNPHPGHSNLTVEVSHSAQTRRIGISKVLTQGVPAQRRRQTHPGLQELDGGRRQQVEQVQDGSRDVALLARVPGVRHRQQLVRLQPLLQVIDQLLACMADASMSRQPNEGSWIFLEGTQADWCLGCASPCPTVEAVHKLPNVAVNALVQPT